MESVLKREGFEGDDMLQEGFQEVISKGEICFRIVDKLNEGLIIGSTRKMECFHLGKASVSK